MNQPIGVTLYKHGFTPLVCVIPPSATLAPGSKITAAQLGKTPGRKYTSGAWGGYAWTQHEASSEDVLQWSLDGANLGLRADTFPAVDIDVLDADIAARVEAVALRVLGPAPVRTGKPPKRLLMYRTDAPFGRVALLLKSAQHAHLVEVLGRGRQYLIAGTHPSGRPYQWDRDLARITADSLTPITLEQVERFFAVLQDELGDFFDVERVGTGRERVAVEQTHLRAPTTAMLAEAMAAIPNDDATAPDRESYIRMGYAIRAAGAEDEEEAFEIFADWAGRHAADGRVEGNPETWRADWRRMRPPYSLGWPWIAELARSYGVNIAAAEFDVAAEPVPDIISEDEHADAPVRYSEFWLAQEVARDHGELLRFAPASGQWLVWDSTRWRHDALLLAENTIAQTLRRIAAQLARVGATETEKQQNLAKARALSTSARVQAVAKLVQADRRMAVHLESFDPDPWVLNTPGGIVDLRTGQLHPHDPVRLCTKTTAVAPDFGGGCPEWKRFLAEATDGDEALETYLQRVAGYALTGTTLEQILLFIWGAGGNGKSVFLNALSGILGDYAATAPMETFVEARGERHPTDVAGLRGARLVAASETQAGKRWDEARLKSLTGGEPVTARYMRQDYFTFTPQFTLVFVGNHKPELRDIDPALRRRIRMVPFTVTPKRVDPLLGQKLRAEWPAILAWAIEGCLDWQRGGLPTPTAVQAFTQDYFQEQDALGRFLEECTRPDASATASTQSLFEAWRTWAQANGEYVGSMRRLSQALAAKGLAKWREPGTGKRGFEGLTLLDPSLSELMYE